VAAAADLSLLHSSLQINFRSSTKCKKERRPVDVPKQQPSMQARRRRSSSSAREAAAATGATTGREEVGFCPAFLQIERERERERERGAGGDTATQT